MKTTAAITALAATAAAWPAVVQQDMLLKRAAESGRLNTGAGHPNPTFDAESQYVDVTDNGPNAFKAPTATDLRGQCPGLNAAANHGFLPRDGKATIQETITGLGDAYGMSPDLAAALAAIAILISGDIPSGQWSIGAGFPSSLPLVLSDPKGIVGSHNKYEGDSSIVRGDAYLNDGNVGVFQWRSWNNLMSLMEDDDNLTLDKTTQQSQFVTDYSIKNNPHYFSGPFSGLVAPAAHNFVINFMSNHTAETPGGTLNKDILKQFFAVTGTGAGASGENPGDFVQHRGQERIPEDWYRRNTADAYNLPDVVFDLLAGAATNPETIRIGGNTGTVNSFTGVELSDVTGGVFNAGNLLQGNNLACFAFQAAQAGGIDELEGLESVLGQALSPITNALSSSISGLTCPDLKSFNQNHFSIFPGFTDPA